MIHHLLPAYKSHNKSSTVQWLHDSEFQLSLIQSVEGLQLTPARQLCCAIWKKYHLTISIVFTRTVKTFKCHWMPFDNCAWPNSILGFDSSDDTHYASNLLFHVDCDPSSFIFSIQIYFSKLPAQSKIQVPRFPVQCIIHQSNISQHDPSSSPSLQVTQQV